MSAETRPKLHSHAMDMQGVNLCSAAMQRATVVLHPYRISKSACLATSCNRKKCLNYVPLVTEVVEQETP
jgi:hypothetical protein